MVVGRYRHWKGAIYRVLGVGIMTESDETVVIYVDDQPAEPPLYYVRPLTNFLSAAGPEGVPRFSLLDAQPAEPPER